LGTCRTDDSNAQHLKSLQEIPTRNFSTNPTAVVIDLSATDNDGYQIQTYTTTDLHANPAILSSLNPCHNNELSNYKWHLNNIDDDIKCMVQYWLMEQPMTPSPMQNPSGVGNITARA